MKTTTAQPTIGPGSETSHPYVAKASVNNKAQSQVNAESQTKIGPIPPSSSTCTAVKHCPIENNWIINLKTADLLLYRRMSSH